MGLAGLAVAATVAVPAIDWPWADDVDCSPEPLTASPVDVVVGRTFTLSSGGFACQDTYGEGKQYDLELAYQGRAEADDLGKVDVAADGSFSTAVTVPADAPPGEAGLLVRGSPLDDCPADASCAGYGVVIQLLPTP